MNKQLIDEFCQLYQSLGKDNLDLLAQVYRQDIAFIDPIHQINGLDALTTYFNHLYQNMISCQFNIEYVIVDDKQASIIWTMHYQHSKINAGKSISVNGSSFLKYDEKIYYHRDYFDVGQMLYEQLPLLSSVITMVKKRAVA
ncbi:MAG: nuclear transport factor 2 family protein [Psychromonas sp.]